MPDPHAPIISSGLFRGRRLTVPPGRSTRPTRGLVRQALFNMLGDAVEGALVLDLYSGSGALGLEALSRGARRVVSVENDRRALAALRENAARCGVDRAAHRIVATDVLRLPPLGEEPFELVLADPPFSLTTFLPERLEEPGVLAPGAVLAVHAPSERARVRTGPGWVLRRTRIHGRSALHVLDRLEAGSGPQPEDVEDRSSR
jgi:16S rRNA (guanine966-N2)-methyltransferase